jgi:hypothetical protein
MTTSEEKLIAWGLQRRRIVMSAAQKLGLRNDRKSWLSTCIGSFSHPESRIKFRSRLSCDGGYCTMAVPPRSEFFYGIQSGFWSWLMAMAMTSSTRYGLINLRTPISCLKALSVWSVLGSWSIQTAVRACPWRYRGFQFQTRSPTQPAHTPLVTSMVRYRLMSGCRLILHQWLLWMEDFHGTILLLKPSEVDCCWATCAWFIWRTFFVMETCHTFKTGVELFRWAPWILMWLPCLSQWTGGSCF